MVWVLDGSIWQEGDWYVSHCKDLEIASQGKTVQEARENLEEATRLYFSKQPQAPRLWNTFPVSTLFHLLKFKGNLKFGLCPLITTRSK